MDRHQVLPTETQNVKGKEAGGVESPGNPDVQGFSPVDAVLHLVESSAYNLAVKDASDSPPGDVAP